MMALALSMLVLAQVPEVQEPLENCLHSPETGEVRCAGEAFGQLVYKLLDARAERDVCALKRSTCETRLAVVEAALVAPKPTPVVQQPKVRPIIAVVTAVVGTAAISTALLYDKMDSASRVGLGITGTVALGASVAIIAF